jgi:hypothetical protein
MRYPVTVTVTLTAPIDLDYAEVGESIVVKAGWVLAELIEGPTATAADAFTVTLSLEAKDRESARDNADGIVYLVVYERYGPIVHRIVVVDATSQGVG